MPPASRSAADVIAGQRRHACARRHRCLDRPLADHVGGLADRGGDRLGVREVVLRVEDQVLDPAFCERTGCVLGAEGRGAARP